MKTTNHLLACLIEECGETAKECCKALRFGLNDQVTLDPKGPRGTTGPTNRAKISREFLDALGVYQMLVDAGELEDIGLMSLPFWVRREMGQKSDKVRAYMEYAEGIGALESPTQPLEP